MHHYAGLSQLVGADVWVKHENHQPIGALKVRGGLNLVAGLSKAERRVRPVYGIHWQPRPEHRLCRTRVRRSSHDCHARTTANADKVAAIRGLGAEVVFHGADFDTAREWMMHVAAERGGVFVGPTDERLICGVGTYAFEIFEDLPDVDMILVPVGAGSGVCGTSIVAKTVNPRHPGDRLPVRTSADHAAELGGG